MSDQNDKMEIEVDIDDSSFKEAWKAFTDQMEKNGFSRSQMNQWACVRFHPHHHWGMCCVTVNGHKSVAFIQPGVKENTFRLAFVAVNKDMEIIDMYGNKADKDFEIPASVEDRTVN